MTRRERIFKTSKFRVTSFMDDPKVFLCESTENCIFKIFLSIQVHVHVNLFCNFKMKSSFFRMCNNYMVILVQVKLQVELFWFVTQFLKWNFSKPLNTQRLEHFYFVKRTKFFWTRVGTTIDTIGRVKNCTSRKLGFG